MSLLQKLANIWKWIESPFIRDKDFEPVSDFYVDEKNIYILIENKKVKIDVRALLLFLSERIGVENHEHYMSDINGLLKSLDDKVSHETYLVLTRRLVELEKTKADYSTIESIKFALNGQDPLGSIQSFMEHVREIMKPEVVLDYEMKERSIVFKTIFISTYGYYPKGLSLDAKLFFEDQWFDLGTVNFQEGQMEYDFETLRRPDVDYYQFQLKVTDKYNKFLNIVKTLDVNLQKERTGHD